MSGEYLLSFFEGRQQIEIKPNGEADVLCPFVHDKGYETRSSAHINPAKEVFHCKTCQAEGRFNEGGLHEIGFVANYHKISYTEALKFVKMFSKNTEEDPWNRSVEHLLEIPEYMNWLAERGITKEAVLEYEIGYLGVGPTYPVYINGVLVDKRHYDIHYKENNTPKIKSEAGSSVLLFPYDHWKKDNRPTLLCAGENDTILARLKGFNALTATFGEGKFPKMFVRDFKDKTVHICYDCDEAGRNGAYKVAFTLKEGGANVFLVDLGLAGTKEDKDITDFFIKHGKTADDLQALIDKAVPFTGEMYQEEKNKVYPLVNLWEVHHNNWKGRYISSRVQMMGKDDQPLGFPAAVEWKCYSPSDTSEICATCPIKGKEGWWTLDEDNMASVLKLAEVPEEQQNKYIDKLIRRPSKCPGGCQVTKREQKYVWKVILAPDVETEDELSGYRPVEHIAYVLDYDMTDSSKYRVFMRCFPHPKTTTIVSIVDLVEESDNAINTFKLTDEIRKQLSQFQGPPKEQMEKRFEVAKRYMHPSSPQLVVEAVNIMYHSALDFRVAGKLLDKGNPEGLIISESQSGKTTTSLMHLQLFGVGNLTNCKDASAVGLKGGVTESKGMGGHRIRWGVIPRNHMGLVILDEMSGISKEAFASLTYIRSQRKADIKKIASGEAPAKTRMLWLSNPREQSDGCSKPVDLYPSGVEICLELIGTDQDIARFDFIIVLPENNVYFSPFTEETLAQVEIDRQAYRNLIYWVWSRNADQVKFAAKVEEYMWQKTQELNERYDTRVKLFGPKTLNKVARIAVSVAAMCFSNTDDGESILVQKEHVDWACDFLVRCYDNNTFRIRSFVERERAVTTTNEEINTIFAGLVRSQGQVMKTLSDTGSISLYQLQMMTGLDKDQFANVISNLAIHGLITTTKTGVMITKRFRKAQEAYINALDKQSLIPLSRKGDVPI